MDGPSGGLMDPEVIQCPFAFDAQLRDGPAIHFDAHSGFHVASRDAVVRRILRDTTIFSNRIYQPGLKPGGLPQLVRSILAKGLAHVPTIHQNDPPSHGRYRQLVDKGFSAARVRQMEATIRVLTDALLADLAGGEVDIVAQFCVPLPLSVVADALGVPRSHMARFKAWSDAHSELRGMVAPETRLVECAELMLECQRYFQAEIAARRREPRDDLLSDLSRATIDGTLLSAEELHGIISQILVAGNESTAGALGEGVRLLATMPDLADRLRSSPALIDRFVEEVLRLASPVQGVMRVVTTATEIDGVALPQGSLVYCKLGAANRDAACWNTADTCVLDRASLSHLAFGFGVHFCLGAAIARAEMKTGFGQLLRRLDRLWLAPDQPPPSYHPVLHLRGLTALRIGYTRAAAPVAG